MAADLAVTLQRLRRADFARLAQWLAAPHVARWWDHETDAAAVERDFGPIVDGADPADAFVAVDAAGAPFGYLQRYPIAPFPEYVAELEAVTPVPAGAWSIDYLVGDAARLGRGWGRSLVVEGLRRLWADEPSALAVVVPVHADNVASRRALLGAGLREIGAGTMTPDNPADDGRHVIYGAFRT
jgi:aminoglycoside 6'-N-acetyltransferase